MNEEEEIARLRREANYWLNVIEQAVRNWAMDDDYCYLCCNCGFITPFAKWTLWTWEEEWDESEGQKMIPAPKGMEDPICRCPVCQWNHLDDPGNPGMRDGTRAECEEARIEEAQAFEDHWNDVAQEIVGGK